MHWGEPSALTFRETTYREHRDVHAWELHSLYLAALNLRWVPQLRINALCWAQCIDPLSKKCRASIFFIDFKQKLMACFFQKGINGLGLAECIDIVSKPR